MTLTICLAGATGWAGSALARGIHAAHDLQLVSGVSRSHAGKALGEVLGIPDLNTPLRATVEEALAFQPEIFFEFTKPDAAMANILTALRHGCHVVVGTSGLSDEDYRALDAAAQAAGRGVLAVGNFALTVVLLQKFAEMAARYIPHWEIIDYAHAGKVDAPSGTARELSARLGRVHPAQLDVPLEETRGPLESRGARLNGTQVHSLRLPGYTLSVDVVFGMPDQKLILRHEAGTSAEPYVQGGLLAIRTVNRLTGLHRGLDSVMEFS